MKGITVFDTMTDIREDYIRDAELDAHLLAVLVPKVGGTRPKRANRASALGRFMSSGLGVAVICAVVAVSVLGGIIWAGFQGGVMNPAYHDAIHGEVYLSAGGQVAEPQAFFGYSEEKQGNQYTTACGAGFDGVFTVSPVPTLTYAADLYLHMPDNYTLDVVYVYAPESPLEVLYTFETTDDLQTLTVGTYYVALRITYTEGKNEYGYDYAFCLMVAFEASEAS